jgi:RNA recognition motif-containing protein
MVRERDNQKPQKQICSLFCHRLTTLRQPETVSAASQPASIKLRGYTHMSVRLYVGNLPFSATEQDLEQLFGKSGSVDSVNIVTDRDTGRSRGFGFVEMESQESADSAHPFAQRL